ncbi:hypothetical protein PHYBOEH_005854 [Phytophthora boehmeriae]|uniref:Uncharacterized protein n=1 Tax=Phytophthora boehmeriae TaxID=109152 RepID=A0A8T1WL99_9STRA|nr:hypothetical protein PHYBOEH_005854 [Phytophthora boehmeriae]
MSGVGERGQRRKRLGSSDVDYRSLMLGLEKDDEDDEDFEPDEEFETEEEEGFDGQEVEKFDGVEDEEEFDGEGKEESDRVQEEESGGEAEVEFAGNTHLADTEEDSDDIDSMDEDDRVDSEVVEISEDGETHGDEDSGSATTTNEEVGVSVAHAKTLHKKRVPSSQTPLPVAKKRVKRIECSSESSSDEDFGASAGDYEPRNRRSSTRAEKRALEEAHAWVHNVVPPFPTKQLLSWQDFDKELKIYKKKNNLLFRVRSSESTATHNAYVFLVLYI